MCVENARFTRNDVVFEGRLLEWADTPELHVPTAQLRIWLDLDGQATAGDERVAAPLATERDSR